MKETIKKKIEKVGTERRKKAMNENNLKRNSEHGAEIELFKNIFERMALLVEINKETLTAFNDEFEDVYSHCISYLENKEDIMKSFQDYANNSLEIFLTILKIVKTYEATSPF